jgi:hypothetical protein
MVNIANPPEHRRRGDRPVAQRSREGALGAYLSHTFLRANPAGRGKTARQLRKDGDVERTDPGILGKFRVDMRDKNAEEVFVSRANF